MIRRLVIAVLVLLTLGCVAGGLFVLYIGSNLPKMVTLEDYRPRLVSEVYDSKGQKIGEFFNERRILTPYEKIPQRLVKAFVAAEDAQFFEHEGINFTAIARAMIANIKAGRKVQGGSTITQQLSRQLMLSLEKTWTRKITEIILSYQMEQNLAKEQILYLYLNQIYLGGSAYGVEAATQTYFRKPVEKITLAEAAILAGMPQAPSRYSPTINPRAAKQRQKYVLRRMVDEGFVTEEEAKKAGEEEVTIYVRENFASYGPYYLETVRQYLVAKLGAKAVLDDGLKIYTSLDLKKQLKAQQDVQKGLREVDKRQGFRGAKKNLATAAEIGQFLGEQKDKLIEELSPVRTLTLEGTLTKPAQSAKANTSAAASAERPSVPDYVALREIVDGVVTRIDDTLGLTYVRFAEGQGLIDIDTMKWARKPNPDVRSGNEVISKPSDALKAGDIIQVKVVSEKFDADSVNRRIGNLKKKKDPNLKINPPAFEKMAELELEQEPTTEGSLISFDLKTQDVLAMVGGYSYARSEFNRAIQAARQTGSSFKPIVYLAGLDKNYNPATMIVDAPIVYQDEKLSKYGESETSENKVWKPGNYDTKFGGDILFRNALIQSKNIPTIKILETVGVERVASYARRLGIFSPLNMDMSLGLGSSSVTLYEMTKVFSTFALNGKRIRPRFILSVKSREGQELLGPTSLDERFQEVYSKYDAEFEEKRRAFLQASANSGKTEGEATPDAEADKTIKNLPPLYFQDPDQLISPQTAYLITSLLAGAIKDPGATGAKARSMGRTVAGKTGTTNGYFDAWFIGYTPHIATGVWVGHDEEKSLGHGETGGEAALPIWIEYMQSALDGVEDRDFTVPPKIVFANIDNETGKPAVARTKVVVRQAFLEGTEPSVQLKSGVVEPDKSEERDFLKDDLTE